MNRNGVDVQNARLERLSNALNFKKNCHLTLLRNINNLITIVIF